MWEINFKLLSLVDIMSLIAVKLSNLSQSFNFFMTFTNYLISMFGISLLIILSPSTSQFRLTSTPLYLAPRYYHLLTYTGRTVSNDVELIIIGKPTFMFLSFYS
ncbi:hypothetical protein [Metallosphaera hakonensis]|uniref:Uncharacterized protein n=1 Tax=Metallosphaera hakonensis JCM 8857 = DSM 7519 TaxID=1293036 RepID=A0A2U9ISW6_9CREN|nr:hypothetical protein [Metallosphaera hakonensis]AWR99161.1 hypothetical protein DFR87_04985 [Metallosphaera hakonensis JCM 8857 = DSM 7519]